MRHTIIDVADAQARRPLPFRGCSTITVTSAPRRRAGWSRRRVELGYQPNWQARALKGKSSGLVGLIIPDISNTYYTAVAQGVTAAAPRP